MESEKYPLLILLFSGKRKSGKDYFTDLLLKQFNNNDKVKVIKISAPIKSYFAKTLNLNLSELMGDGAYKEKYRKEMIDWSDEMRDKDAGIFCRQAVDLYKGNEVPVWIVSDIRRKTDVKWFKETYGDIVKNIRIEVDDETRKERGWVFTPNIDDIPSECDLDDFKDWDWKIYNSNLSSNSQEMLFKITAFISEILNNL